MLSEQLALVSNCSCSCIPLENDFAILFLWLPKVNEFYDGLHNITLFTCLFFYLVLRKAVPHHIFVLLVSNFKKISRSTNKIISTLKTNWNFEYTKKKKLK